MKRFTLRRNKLFEALPIPNFIHLEIRRRDDVEFLTTLEEGAFKMPIVIFIFSSVRNDSQPTKEGTKFLTVFMSQYTSGDTRLVSKPNHKIERYTKKPPTSIKLFNLGLDIFTILRVKFIKEKQKNVPSFLHDWFK